MSMGPLSGLAASVAGSQLAQSTGSDVERAQQAARNQERRVQNEVRAENAAGIGETDGEDHETAERDADGRRPWEHTGRPNPPAAPSSATAPQSKDASGQSGTLLDLTG